MDLANGDLHLQSGSPCIDTGDPWTSWPTDMEGNARVDIPSVGTVGTTEDMGALGFRVDHPDQVGDALKTAIDSGRPCVINAIVQGGEAVLAEPFRRDAMKKPVVVAGIDKADMREQA